MEQPGKDKACHRSQYVDHISFPRDYSAAFSNVYFLNINAGTCSFIHAVLEKACTQYLSHALISQTPVAALIFQWFLPLALVLQDSQNVSGLQ